MWQLLNALVAAGFNAIGNGMNRPIFNLLNFLFRWALGTSPALWTNVVRDSNLAGTYANGTLGVGATLTKASAGALGTIDGVTPYLGMTVLLTAQSTPFQNGLYKVTNLGSSTVAWVLTRWSGWDQSAEMVNGSAFYVTSGTSYGGQVWAYTAASSPTVGATTLTFARDTILRSALGTARAGFVMYAAPPANEATAGASTLVTDVAISAVALTLAAQPKYPCKLNIYKTDADSSYAATLTIIGVGPGGEALTEVVPLLAADGTHTYVTTNAFATITSATVSALSGNTGADKIAIGQKSALGLPIPLGAANVVVFKEGVAATSAAAPTNETAGTVDTTARTVIPTTAPDGTKAFSFWYSYS